MLENLRAVPWFAEMEPGGGEVGGVVAVEGSGELRTAPKGSKAEDVSGTALIVMVDEGAIVEILSMGSICEAFLDGRWMSLSRCEILPFNVSKYYGKSKLRRTPRPLNYVTM